MKRILLVASAAALMVMMVSAMATPAFAVSAKPYAPGHSEGKYFSGNNHYSNPGHLLPPGASNPGHVKKTY